MYILKQVQWSCHIELQLNQNNRIIGMFVHCILFINLLQATSPVLIQVQCSFMVVLIKQFLLDIPVPSPKGGDKTLWYIIGPASGFVLIAVLVGVLYMKRSSSRGDGHTVPPSASMDLIHFRCPENGNTTCQMNTGVKETYQFLF